MGYIKELVLDFLKAIQVGYNNFKHSYSLNRGMTKTLAIHHKLVKERGHCGAFLVEIETYIDDISDEDIAICVDDFINWAESVSDEFPDITPKNEPEWEEVLSYQRRKS